MFKIFYTTHMSVSARQLQARFIKMRTKRGRSSRTLAAVVTAALVFVMATATVVMAAVGSDGLEYWTHNEAYLIAGISGKTTTDLSTAPDWVKEISTDGVITVTVNRINIRNTYGYVEHTLSAQAAGNRGSRDFLLTGGRSLFTATEENSGFLPGDPYQNPDIPCMIVDFDYTGDGDRKAVDENHIYVCFAVGSSKIMSFIGDYEQEFPDVPHSYIDPATVSYNGDFNEVERQYDGWSGFQGKFTYYDKDFHNTAAEGISFEITGADVNGVRAKVNIDNPKAKSWLMTARPARLVLKESSTGLSYKTSELNHTEVALAEQPFSPFVFKKGETYVVDFVVFGESGDGGMPVIYRRREYVTIK